MTLDSWSTVLKASGAIVSFVGGLTALNFEVRKDGRWTRFGMLLAIAISLGAVLSIAGFVVDQQIKAKSDAETTGRFEKLQSSADAQRYTTANATASFTLSLEKDSPSLKRVRSNLDAALNYAKAHCIRLGGVAHCRDYVVRDLVVEEIRFDRNSQIYRQLTSVPEVAQITKRAGVVVRFFPKPFPNSAAPSEASMGGMLLSPSLKGSSSLFEYDGKRLRWFVDVKLPADAFQVARVSSLVDLKNGSGTARAYAFAEDFCHGPPDSSACAHKLLEILNSLEVELVSFEFPHGRGISFIGSEKRIGEFGIPYLYQAFPGSVDEFPKNS